MNFHLRPLGRLLSLSALAMACTLAAPGCRRRNPMPTPGEENTIPLPNPQPNPQQNEPGAPDPRPMGKPNRKPGAGRVAQANASLPVALKSDKASYRRGETLSFTMTMRNASDQTQTLRFTSGQNFDLLARRADAAADSPPLWRWASDKMFTREIRDVSLRPGEEREFTATWDQSGGDAQALPRGSYVVTAEIASVPRLASNAVTVELAN